VDSIVNRFPNKIDKIHGLPTMMELANGVAGVANAVSATDAKTEAPIAALTAELTLMRKQHSKMMAKFNGPANNVTHATATASKVRTKQIFSSRTYLPVRYVHISSHTYKDRLFYLWEYSAMRDARQISQPQPSKLCTKEKQC
jgi:hypothetical protein